jgi:hypothetical protein
MQSSGSKLKICQEFFLLRVCKIKKKLAKSKSCDTLKKIKNQKQLNTKSKQKNSRFISVSIFSF